MAPFARVFAYFFPNLWCNSLVGEFKKEFKKGTGTFYSPGAACRTNRTGKTDLFKGLTQRRGNAKHFRLPFRSLQYNRPFERTMCGHTSL